MPNDTVESLQQQLKVSQEARKKAEDTVHDQAVIIKKYRDLLIANGILDANKY